MFFLFCKNFGRKLCSWFSFVFQHYQLALKDKSITYHEKKLISNKIKISQQKYIYFLKIVLLALCDLIPRIFFLQLFSPKLFFSRDHLFFDMFWRCSIFTHIDDVFYSFKNLYMERDMIGLWRFGLLIFLVVNEICVVFSKFGKLSLFRTCDEIVWLFVMCRARQCLMIGTYATLDQDWGTEGDCAWKHIVHCRVIVDNKCEFQQNVVMRIATLMQDSWAKRGRTNQSQNSSVLQLIRV